MAPPQRIAIQFAVPQELTPAARLLQPAPTSRPDLARISFRHGLLHGKELLLLAGGMGQKRAGAGAEAIVRSWRPDLLVMAGVAGALAADLRVAEVIAASTITTGEAAYAPSVLPALASGAHRTGALLSLDQVLVTAEDKRKAVAALAYPRPLAVEMETAAVAQVASRHGLPWTALRAVSDTAEESLPLDFNRLRTADGDLPTSRVAIAAVSNPAAIPGLIRLGKNTSLAAEALASFLEKWISSL